MTVTLQFSTPDLAHQNFQDRLVSTGIKKMTRSEISHVDLVMPDGTLLGAHMTNGIQRRPADYEKFGLRIRVTVPASDPQQAAFYGYALSMTGTPYDVETIVGIATGDARKHTPGKMICSEFAAYAVDDHSGICRVAKDKWQVSPEELRIALMALPGAVEERIIG
jgi:hypothetical protein